MLRAVIASLAVLAPAAAAQDDLSGAGIVARAHQAAGAEAWTDPGSLYMEGYALFWTEGHEPVRYEPYRMWRVFPEDKTDAHQADGRVRIEAFREGETVFQLSFDGQHTYTADGRVEEEADSSRWASNFGFGVIRHALEEGYSVSRLPDDSVDGRAAYTVRVHDPAGGQTLFSIAMDDFAIVRVGFDTPQGWHERIYSDFFANTPGGFVQPGRVRLYYDGVKANEIFWQRFETGEAYEDALFRLGQ